jgi:hypothetical protein
VDALVNPSVQRMIPIVLAAIAALALVTFLGVLVTARGPLPAQARVFRRRVGAVALFVVVAAGAAFLVLRTPIESDIRALPVAAPSPSGSGDAGEGEVVSETRFSSAGLPALSLDAPDGWKLEWNKASRKLSAASDGARLLVSSAILTEAVDVEVLLAKLAETQRALGFEVGDTFTDRLGDLPAAGFLATGPVRSVCTWIVKRDTHLASSVICTAEGKQTAREACRALLARLRWRTPRQNDR